MVAEELKLVDAQHGTFFMMESEKDEPVLNMIASFAFTTRKNVSNHFKLKEGLVGDLLLLDIIMPGMDGIQTLEKLKTEELLKGMKVHHDDYLMAPYTDTAKVLYNAYCHELGHIFIFVICIMMVTLWVDIALRSKIDSSTSIK